MDIEIKRSVLWDSNIKVPVSEVLELKFDSSGNPSDCWDNLNWGIKHLSLNQKSACNGNRDQPFKIDNNTSLKNFGLSWDKTYRYQKYIKWHVESKEKYSREIIKWFLERDHFSFWF